jgi:hypothetical protein
MTMTNERHEMRNENYRDTLNEGWAIPPLQDATVLTLLLALMGGIIGGILLTVRRVLK